MYTSLKFSKWLKEKGFEVECEDVYGNELDPYNQKTGNITIQPIWWFKHFNLESHVICNTYDILNDLCVKYEHKIFKENKSHYVLYMMQENKPQEEIEDFIISNSILNQ